jgi:hypothetical protein
VINKDNVMFYSGISSEELMKEVIKNLKEYSDVRYLTPSDLNNLAGLNKPECIGKIKRVLDLLIFNKALKFNQEYMLWENCFYEEKGE